MTPYFKKAYDETCQRCDSSYCQANLNINQVLHTSALMNVDSIKAESYGNSEACNKLLTDWVTHSVIGNTNSSLLQALKARFMLNTFRLCIFLLLFLNTKSVAKATSPGSFFLDFCLAFSVGRNFSNKSACSHLCFCC